MREFDNPAYRPLAPNRPADPWQTSAAAKTAREDLLTLGYFGEGRLLPDDEQEDAEPRPDIDAIERQAKRDHAAGVRAGRFVKQAFYVLAVLAFVWVVAEIITGGRP